MDDRLDLTRPDQVKALTHPLRHEILDRLQDRPATPSEVARAMGIPANKVHYHVRILEKAGIVKLVETRQVGSVTETYFAPAARNIEIRLHGAAGQEHMAEGFSLINGEVQALLADLQKLTAAPPADPAGKPTVILSRLRADDDGQHDVTDALQRLQERFDLLRQQSPGRKFRLAVALVPMDEQAGEE